jgi:hypothetical protein
LGFDKDRPDRVLGRVCGRLAKDGVRALSNFGGLALGFLNWELFRLGLDLFLEGVGLVICDYPGFLAGRNSIGSSTMIGSIPSNIRDVE